MIEMKTLKKYLSVLKQSILSWWGRDAFSQSAAAAFYAVFSLPGLLMIVMAVAALGFEQQRAEYEILGHVRNVLGPDVALNMKAIIDSTQSDNRDFWAMSVGIATLAFGATGLFAQLQKSLNYIWGVEVKKSANFLSFLKVRAIGFGICVSVGFLLLISLVLTALLSAAGEWMAQHFSESMTFLFYIINYLFSLTFIGALFSVIYKVLPDVELKWRDVFRGGILAGVLFTSGEYGLSLYFKIARPESTFGAAGSMILFLLWIFYSCLILFFGAEFIRAYTEKNKEKPLPNEISKAATRHA
jgi:membrane protein